jgi:hypothetical protein
VNAFWNVAAVAAAATFLSSRASAQDADALANQLSNPVASGARFVFALLYPGKG